MKFFPPERPEHARSRELWEEFRAWSAWTPRTVMTRMNGETFLALTGDSPSWTREPTEVVGLLPPSSLP